jgi:hypothetical protein
MGLPQRSTKALGVECPSLVPEPAPTIIASIVGIYSHSTSKSSLYKGAVSKAVIALRRDKQVASEAKHRVYRGEANLFVEYFELQAYRLPRFARNDDY